MYRFYPAINSILSRIRPVPEMARLADSVEILCPEEIGKYNGIYMIPDEWKKITKFENQTSEHQERNRINGGVAIHKATIRYEFHNVLATPFGFHVLGGSYSGIGGGHFSTLTARHIVTHENGLYASSYLTSKYFGHWLLDGLSTALLRLNNEKLYLWSDPRAKLKHGAQYIDLLGIDRINEPFVYFKKMSFCDDVGQNFSRRSRLKKIKTSINNKKGRNFGGMVYMKRGKSGVLREIENEPEVINTLKEMGFLITDVHQPLSEILDSAAGTKITVSIEGSNLAHLMLAAATGATHIVINPADRFNNVLADYLPGLGDGMATIVAERGTTGYRVDVKRLVSLINKISQQSDTIGKYED